MSLTLRTISREQHLAYIQSLPSASHCQVPAWADVKNEWRSENLGWFDDKSGQMVGVGLVLYRQIPKVKRYLAYLPEGPVINWYAPNLEDWLQPMLAHLKSQGAFTVKMGPPVIIRRWEATAVKAGIADPDVKRLRDVEATFVEPRAFEVADRLRRMGWQQGEDGGGVSAEKRIQRNSLGTHSDAEVNLHTSWVDNLATADNPRAVLLRAGYIGRVRNGLSTGERREAQARRQQASEWTQTVDPRFISRLDSKHFSKRGCFSRHVPFSSWIFS